MIDGPNDMLLQFTDLDKNICFIIGKLTILMADHTYIESLLSNTRNKLPVRKRSGKVCTISFERPVNYLCDAWHVFQPKWEAWTYFNN